MDLKGVQEIPVHGGIRSLRIAGYLSRCSFLVALTKTPRALPQCRDAIRAALGGTAAAGVTFHAVEVDADGLCVDGAPAFR